MKPSVQEESTQKPLKKNGHRQALGQDIRGSRERGELYNRDPGFDRKLRKRLARVEDLMGKMPRTATWGNKEWMELASERREIIDTLKHAKNGGGRGPGGDGGKLAGVEEPHPSGFDRDYRRELLDKAVARLQGGREKTAKRLRSAREESLRQRHPEKYAQPGDTAVLRTESIGEDAARFQYKRAYGKGGSVGSLKDIKKYNPTMAGTIQVWRDPADGRIWVINGHNRLEAAKRFGVEHMKTEFINARTEKEARAEGALTNIAEGNGTALDAAQFFRDSEMTPEEILDTGISMHKNTASQGLALSRLDRRIFDRVASGEERIARGAVIGDSGLSHAQQWSVYEQLAKQEKGRKHEVNDKVLREMIENAQDAGVTKKKQTGLFGETEEEFSLDLYRGQIQSDVKDALLKEKGLFGKVSDDENAQMLAEKGKSYIDVEETEKISKEAATVLGLFRMLKNRSGPGSIFTRAAERLDAGESRADVSREARDEFIREVNKYLGGETLS